MTRTPVSTYRLQLTADFPLTDAAAIVDYLRALGVDWVYLSPLLQAAAGSTHGYDVTDHARVDASRGGEAGLQAMADAAHREQLGVLADIVPNHVGVADASETAWWWNVLQHGPGSPFAEHFDIDWAAGGGRLIVPVLGETLEEAAEAGTLRVVGEELRYHDHRYPLSPGSAETDDDVLAVHAAQHYELVDWRRADHDLNYRRFFAVNELAAIRVEQPEVFDASHVEIVRWLREGLVDGLRVDHPDGLADPGGYLDALAAATNGAYVLVEKILEGGETLPPFWATAGTTGYDALAELDRVLVDPAGRARLDALDAKLRQDGGRPWSELIHDTKRAIADGILHSEVRRLARDSRWSSGSRPEAEDAAEGLDGARPAGASDVEDAIAELLACFPVYRSYLPFGAEHLEAALADARTRRPELAATLDELAPILGDPQHPAAIRFQQTSGMVMAKGVEDTAFYRVSRLASLTEVGADPAEFSLTTSTFHERQQTRLAAHPLSMTTLSTHDTKRGEDTRARISVIAETPEEWVAFLARRREHHPLADGAFENVLWESIVGSWPRDREALHAYAEKAAREAGTSTEWADPDEKFETRMHRLIDELFDDPQVTADVEAMVAVLAPAGRSNGLAIKLLQLTGPGVPDVYQGSELWERSLVDPDNRRAVDFDERRAILTELDAGFRPPVEESGAAKLLLVSRALRLRRDRPELFARYVPLPSVGEAADHLVAVDRGGAIALATRLPLGLAARGGWGDTAVLLPNGPFVEQLTGRSFAGGETSVAELLDEYPVALLAADEASL
ncbi:MAG: malto-oligosyltrehalose synthase [Actinomycetota bacterium]|nr:malto-oligosyltrehalose synthase [Actinomycetota bacterium]